MEIWSISTMPSGADNFYARMEKKKKINTFHFFKPEKQIPMKQATLLLLLCIYLAGQLVMAQSNPVALKPGITINRILTVQNGAIRVIRDPVGGNLFYSTTDGRIYEVHQPSGSAAYDSLVYTSADHHVTYAQGFTAHDSTFYISGNDSSNTPLTFGIIARGVLQPNGMRTWSTVMQTDFYQTADYFDHLFSGLAVTPSGDSLVICSGARGDHGEVETRYGLYPGLRNVPLTTNLYIVPANDTGIVILHNDSAWNDTTTLLYARGIRNTFDMAYDAQGRLFGVENSGDRDHHEEMNWLRRGHHYGFPWIMGDTDNPQQFPGFNPASDLLISHYSRTWRIGAWSNDPAFPPPPSVVFDAPIQNFGPDADKYRDPVSGNVMDASDSALSIGTFTAHRSPLGLVFDNDSVMHPEYRGDAFMLSWTKGLDSCGCTAVPDTGIGPFVDPSEDLIHLDLNYDSLIDNFTLYATRIVADFSHPVDDAIDSNKIYVLENGYGGTSGLFEVAMPYIPVCAPAYSIAVSNISCDSALAVASVNSTGFPPYIYDWLDSAGNHIKTDTLQAGFDSLLVTGPGNYTVHLSDSFNCEMFLSFLISAPVQLTVDILDVCDTGMTYAIAHADGPGPFTYEWKSPDSAGTVIQSHSIPSATDTLFNMLPRNYFIEVTDSNGCSATYSFTLIAPVEIDIDSVLPTTCTGCSNGIVYFSMPNGQFTISIDPPLGTQAGNSITGLPAGGYTLCASDSLGCTSCANFILADDPSEVTGIFDDEVLSIYPNPVYGMATILTKSLHPTTISITIYDAMGRKAAAVADELKCASAENKFRFDTKNLSPGCYYVKIKSSDKEITTKMVVMKN